MSEQDYYKAFEIFTELNDFKDSKKKAKENYSLYCISTYQTAINEKNNGNYKEAISLCEKIYKDYSDAKNLLEECRQLQAEKDYNEAEELYDQKQYEQALVIFEGLGDYRNSQEYANSCKEVLERIKNTNDYNAAKSIIQSYDESGDTDKLENAIEILKPLAEKQFLDSEELLNNTVAKLEAIKLAQRKKKRRRLIIFILILVLIITAVCIIVPTSINAHKKKLYSDLITYVNRTNGEVNHDKIESILEELPDHYESSDSYETLYYYKRVNYLVNNYKISYDKEINSLFQKIPSNYKDISDIKSKYYKTLNEKYLDSYNSLLSSIGNYSGSTLQNSNIANYINSMPESYKDVATISAEFSVITSNWSTINSTNYNNNFSNTNGNTVRSALKKIASIDYNSSLWDCSSYYKSLDIRKVIYGARWSYGSQYYFRWYYDSSTSGGQTLSWDIPSNRDSNKSYYFYVNHSSSKLNFGLENKNNSKDSFATFSVSNLKLSGSTLAVDVYIDKLDATYTFTLDD